MVTLGESCRAVRAGAAAIGERSEKAFWPKVHSLSARAFVRWCSSGMMSASSPNPTRAVAAGIGVRRRHAVTHTERRVRMA